MQKIAQYSHLVRPLAGGFGLFIQVILLNMAGASMGWAIACAFLQISAISLGGVPGATRWLLTSRVVDLRPMARSWSGAMLSFSSVTLALYTVDIGDAGLSFFDTSLLLLTWVYAGAKFGCHTLGCCGWSTMRPTFLKRHISLQLFEAIVSATAATCLTVIQVLDFFAPSVVALVLTTIHLSLRFGLKSYRDGYDASRSQLSL